MIKRLILLFLLFLSFSLMGTTAKAMDCESVSKLKTNPGIEKNVSDKDYLKTPVPREEYKQLLESFASYSDCVDKENLNKYIKEDIDIYYNSLIRFC